MAVSAALILRLSGNRPPSNQRAAAAAPDISNMSPRERADRLFNRVMAAVEGGDSAQVNFFVPMALQAYGLLGGLDADARYHVGMIAMAGGDFAAAAAQADSLNLVHPGHLLASALRAETARRQGDAATLKRALAELARNYEREMAKRVVEYEEHRAILERMKQEAR